MRRKTRRHSQLILTSHYHPCMVYMTHGIQPLSSRIDFAAAGILPYTLTILPSPQWLEQTVPPRLQKKLQVNLRLKKNFDV